MNAEKDLKSHFSGEPPGQRCNAVRRLQIEVMRKARALPREFKTRREWESFRDRIRRELPRVIGLPSFPPLGASAVRGRVRVGAGAVCERVDVFADEEYGIPALVFSPAKASRKRRPALVWNPGWNQDKFHPASQQFALRMAARGFVTLIPDHAPFGETTPYSDKKTTGMTVVMSLGNALGISQLALRAAETMRAGEYLRSRPDVDPARVAVAGLCQGGQDTWLSAALDEGFCAAAPICSASTFAVACAEMGSYHALSDASPFPFGILDLCDADHLHAAIAPRPLLVRANLPDHWWPVSGFHDIESLTRRVYRLYGAEKRPDFRAEVHEHNITGPFADALEKFLTTFV